MVGKSTPLHSVEYPMVRIRRDKAIGLFVGEEAAARGGGGVHWISGKDLS